MNSATDWTVEQTKKLFSLCEQYKAAGKSLSRAFEEMSAATGRSPNSVRNYYYAQAKTFELVPEIADRLGINFAEIKRETFVPFSQAEVIELIETVLVDGANGISVRASVYRAAGGDDKKALRLQNKYRSALRAHRDVVEGVMKNLAARGIAYRDPYEKEKRTDNFARLTEYIAALDESKVGNFLSIIERLK